LTFYRIQDKLNSRIKTLRAQMNKRGRKIKTAAVY